MEKLCPLFKGACMEHQCRWFIQILGKNPQTGDPLPNNGWGCAMEWMPVLLIHNSQQTNQLAAAVESQRNEGHNDAMTVSKALKAAAQAVGSQRLTTCVYEARRVVGGGDQSFCLTHGFDCPNAGGQ